MGFLSPPTIAMSGSLNGSLSPKSGNGDVGQRMPNHHVQVTGGGFLHQGS
jgi:hypothetical protein